MCNSVIPFSMATGGSAIAAALHQHKPFRERLCAMLEPHDLLLLHDAFPGLALLAAERRAPLLRSFVRECAVRRYRSAALYRWAMTRGIGYRAGITRACRVQHACEAAAATNGLPLLRCVAYHARKFKLWRSAGAAKRLLVAAAAGGADAVRFVAARCVKTLEGLDARLVAARMLHVACGTRDADVGALLALSPGWPDFAWPRPGAMHVRLAAQADNVRAFTLLCNMVAGRANVLLLVVYAVKGALAGNAERVLRRCARGNADNDDESGVLHAAMVMLRDRVRFTALRSKAAPWLLAGGHMRPDAWRDDLDATLTAAAAGNETLAAFHAAYGARPLVSLKLMERNETGPLQLDVYEALACAEGAADARRWREQHHRQ
jgi:hypothetical protein